MHNCFPRNLRRNRIINIKICAVLHDFLKIITVRNNSLSSNIRIIKSVFINPRNIVKKIFISVLFVVAQPGNNFFRACIFLYNVRIAVIIESGKIFFNNIFFKVCISFYKLGIFKFRSFSNFLFCSFCYKPNLHHVKENNNSRYKTAYKKKQPSSLFLFLLIFCLT